MEAEAISKDTLRPAGSARGSTLAPMSPGASADQDMRALVATIDKARRAAQNTAQVGSGKMMFVNPHEHSQYPNACAMAQGCDLCMAQVSVMVW